MSKKNVKTFLRGIIDIGSHSVRLDIFEQFKDGRLQVLERLNKSLNLGMDTFSKGFISAEKIMVLSEILSGFKKKIAEYGVSECRTFGTSAIREAFNRELLISRIKHETGFDIKILEAQDEAKILYVAVRSELRKITDFDRRSGVAFIVGTGSLIVIYFEKGLLRFSEEIPLGTIRLYDELGNIDLSEDDFFELLDTTGIAKRLKESIKESQNQLTFIGIGAPVREFFGIADGAPAVFMKIEEAAGVKPKKDSEKYNAGHLNRKSSASLFSFFFKRFNFCEFICPGTNTRSALIAEWIRQSQNQSGEDPFLPDMRAMAEYIGEKYGYDAGHAQIVRTFSLAIFDKLAKIYNLNSRDRICMDIAATLHDIGRFIDTRQHHKHSFYLIGNTPLPGLTASEKRIVATSARYHRKGSPKSTHPEYMLLNDSEKVTVLQLGGILRTADALAQCSLDDSDKIKLKLKGDELTVFIHGSDSKSLEKAMLFLKGTLFSDVFGLRLTVENLTETI